MPSPFLNGNQALSLGKAERVLGKPMADPCPSGYLGNALDALRTVTTCCICNDPQNSHCACCELA
ncbi:MAG: hypothetical protein GY949_04305 [Gammaproteobacteria bacterium]|nr:hypothetical protein [Gammaproteobacteria bacterium]